MIISIAAWIEVGNLVLGGIALVLIAGFTNLEPSSLRNLSLVIEVSGYFFWYSR